MIKRLLEKLYNLLDLTLYTDTREVLEAKIEGLELENDRLVDSIEECMVDIENYQDEISNFTSRRWA